MPRLNSYHLCRSEERDPPHRNKTSVTEGQRQHTQNGVLWFLPYAITKIIRAELTNHLKKFQGKILCQNFIQMDKLIISLAFMAIVGVVLAYPADHREDTVLPFSLSPGNVNLETYYSDKYPGPNPAKQAPPEENMFAEESEPELKFRSRREANPQHHHGGYHHDQGHGHYNPPTYHNQPQYGHHHHQNTHGHHHHHG
ncbi:hypothetical protein Ocin01_12777 [Orchesella cincta]|uniref:Uncharacterized protein n=1 Tax=Orchesella cincta TaxID=48709 RepID=A0A1D2MM03_ORCCI|nr:hypothetical protein Ocin01_12777 [Orchesella cincta]